MESANPVDTCHAKTIDHEKRKDLALDVIRNKKSIADTAKENNVSRKFVHSIKDKAVDAVNQAFENKSENDDKVLFNLPVTTSWLEQLSLSLTLNCRSSIRGIQKLLIDVFDHPLSFGTIQNQISDAKPKAKMINDNQDLAPIKLAAEDEMFHYNKPILTGIDIQSLYCFMLSSEQNRDFDTWGVNLLDLKDQGLNPERVIADDASSIRAANQYAFPGMPCDIDNFHIIQDMMDMRRYFRNRLKSTITNKKTIQAKVDKAILTEKYETYDKQLDEAKSQEKNLKQLSSTIDTLVSWMQHDVLNMPGPDPKTRHQLFDFILDELMLLASEHPHRIESVCTTLKNQKPYLLAFADVLNEKFQAIADEYVFPLDKIWEMCALQRCQIGGDKYAVRSIPLQDYFQNEFDDVEDAVLNALNSTERTSSMVENLHSRLRPYFYLRREIGFGYLDLLRFYLNHTPFMRSERTERRGKTPAEILNGKPHPHWLEMLGYKRFKKAA